MVRRLLLFFSVLFWSPVASFIVATRRSIKEPRLLASHHEGEQAKFRDIPKQGVCDHAAIDAIGGCANENPTAGHRTRREAIRSTASSALLAWITLATTTTTPPNAAVAAEGVDLGGTPESPIVVVGAGGKVGTLCTKILADKGLYVRATTRSGRPVLPEESPFVTYASCDVTDDASLKAALTGASGCIFAASASGKKKGGEPIGK
jgi:NAD(P)H-binding